MQTLFAYNVNQAIGANELELNAVVDQSLPSTNNHLLLPQPMDLLYAIGIGTSMTLAKIESPSLRAVTPPYIWPVNNAATPANDPNISDYRDFPLRLPMQEEIVVKSSSSDAAQQRHTVGLFLSSGSDPVPAGAQIFSVRCTAAITAVAYTWSSGALTFGSQLPSGMYAIVSMFVQSATAIFGRLIFPGGTNMRPGVVACTALANRPPFAGRKGVQRVLGTFRNTVPPLLEIFCTAADAAQVVYLDVAKVG